MNTGVAQLILSHTLKTKEERHERAGHSCMLEGVVEMSGFSPRSIQQ